MIHAKKFLLNVEIHVMATKTGTLEEPVWREIKTAHYTAHRLAVCLCISTMSPINDRCFWGLLHVKSGAQFIGGYTLGIGIGYVITTMTQIFEGRFSNYYYLGGILDVLAGIAVLYGIHQNRPFFLLPLIAYTVVVLCGMYIIFMLGVVFIVEPRIIFKSSTDDEVFTYRIVCAMVGVILILAAFVKERFLRTLYDCYKYIQNENYNSNIVQGDFCAHKC
uniref:FUSC family protein n=1 Tax=Steinernema glaseri TaxID=37863 RepID=A0A1I8AVK8_9BILA